MTATTEAKPWDFSHVLDLVNSLSYESKSSSASYQANKEQDTASGSLPTSNHRGRANAIDHEDSEKELEGLGDFSKLWQFLGSAVDSPTPAPTIQIPKTQNRYFQHTQTPAGYASDSAVPAQPHNRNKLTSKREEYTALQDESSGEDLGADTVSDGSAIADTPILTKSQRKKRNRKERRAREAQLAEETAAATTAVTAVPDSEANHVSTKTPAEAESHRAIDSTPKRQYNLRPRDASGKAKGASDLDDAISVAVKKVDAAKKANEETFKPPKNGIHAENPYTYLNQVTTRRQSNPAPLPSLHGGTSAFDALHNRPKLQQASVTPGSGNAYQFLPSTVPPASHSSIPPIYVHPHAVPNQANGVSNRVKVIEPMIVRSGEDRHWALLMKLVGDFYEDRKYLISPMNLTTHNNDPKGIHVFVDASNIFIGFNDQLKRSRGIPWNAQIPSVDLSFDALALLMERRRSVAKRVLVGSTPHLPAFDKAKAVGYECSILEKVYKARELTERQVYFKELDRAYHNRKRAKAPPANNVATLNGGNGSGDGSGSETNTPQYAPARMIEQGVDEILHLKLLESIVDTDVPSTIVLATGDAARAEYSEGFMAMAERALKKGWTVELVSWSKNISAMYTRRAWVEAWGERFRIITLDDYAEELLDM